MLSQNYHKVYMNHVHSSTLLSQLSTMWKSQTLCDAIIKTGAVSTRAHRVVLVAACPMLQTMENATSGSHLEVRLASDISQESVNTFLQYLYEGYMILTEDNCSDVEKIARLLQVDSVTKCCADFNKCINKGAGAQFRYSFHDQTDFKHMRVSDLFRKHERSAKRQGDMHRPSSPGTKRQRMHSSSSPKIHDTSSMAESYGATSDPWDRVPRLGSGFQGPGVVDIREDGFELVQTEPPKKDSTGIQEPVKVQTSVSLSVSSQHNNSSDLRVVNVTGDSGPPLSDRTGKPPQAAPPLSGSSRDPITVSPLAFQDSPSSSSSSNEVSRSIAQHEKAQQKKDAEKLPQPKVHIPDYSDSQYTSEMMNSSTGSRGSEDSSTPYRAPYPVAMTQIPRQPPPKPFASGSATQSVSMPVFPETISSPSSQKSQSTPRERSESSERPPSSGRSVEAGQEKSNDQPDLSIVKIETATERDMSNLEMYMGDEVFSHGHHSMRSEEDDPGPNYNVEEPPGEWQREDTSNESSIIGGMDGSSNWYMGQMKGTGDELSYPHKAGIYQPEDAAKLGLASSVPVYISRQYYLQAMNKIKLSMKTGKTDATPSARFLLGLFYSSSDLLAVEKDNKRLSHLDPVILQAIEEKDPRSPAGPLQFLQNVFGRPRHPFPGSELVKESSAQHEHEENGEIQSIDQAYRSPHRHLNPSQFGVTMSFRSPRPRAPRPEIVTKTREDFEAMEKAGLKHRLVHIADGNNTRNCKMCESMGIRTGTRTVRSYYMCEACGVALCRPQMRNCFGQYHAMVGYFGPLGDQGSNIS